MFDRFSLKMFLSISGLLAVLLMIKFIGWVIPTNFSFDIGGVDLALADHPGGEGGDGRDSCDGCSCGSDSSGNDGGDAGCGSGSGGGE
ncbi:MAG: hypothetical protein AAB597_02035 [Patescibacteria group bacterium]